MGFEELLKSSRKVLLRRSMMEGAAAWPSREYAGTGTSRTSAR